MPPPIMMPPRMLTPPNSVISRLNSVFSELS